MLIHSFNIRKCFNEYDWNISYRPFYWCSDNLTIATFKFIHFSGFVRLNVEHIAFGLIKAML